MVVKEGLLLSILFSFYIVFFKAFDIVITSVGVVLWEEGSLWLPMVMSIVLNSPLTLV